MSLRKKLWRNFMKEKIKANLTNVINQAVQWCDDKVVYEAVKEWSNSIQLQEPEKKEEEDVKE